MTETIASLVLKDPGVIRRKAEIEQERQVALGDLLRENRFSVKGACAGPYHLVLSVEENRLIFDITGEAVAQPCQVKLPVLPFRGIIRDYFMICEQYFEAVAASDPYRLETIDMARRGIHNEGSEMMQRLLEDRVEVDFDTSRRLFTLVCVLHIR